MLQGETGNQTIIPAVSRWKISSTAFIFSISWIWSLSLNSLNGSDEERSRDFPTGIIKLAHIHKSKHTNSRTGRTHKTKYFINIHIFNSFRWWAWPIISLLKNICISNFFLWCLTCLHHDLTKAEKWLKADMKAEGNIFQSNIELWVQPVKTDEAIEAVWWMMSLKHFEKLHYSSAAWWTDISLHLILTAQTRSLHLFLNALSELFALVHANHLLYKERRETHLCDFTLANQ